MARLHDKIWGKSLLPYPLGLTLNNDTKTGHVFEYVHALCPHEVIYFMIQCGFMRYWVHGDEKTCDLEAYWKNYMQLPGCEQHPYVKSPERWATLVPMLFFADDVEISKNSLASLCVFEFSCPLSKRLHSLVSRILVISVLTDRMLFRTNCEIVHFIGWSCQCLLENRFPSYYHGTQVPFPQGSWRQKMAGQRIFPESGEFLGAAFCGVAADLKFRKFTNMFQNGWSSNACCDSCCASKTIAALHYTDNRPSAGWKRTVFTHSEYVNAAGPQVTPWCTVPGFALPRCLFDWVHNCYIGTARDLVASCMIELCYFGHHHHQCIVTFFI